MRVHRDAPAAASARAVKAKAFTVGHDVVFGAGQYAPESAQGQRLLAHELVHTIQQSRGGEAPATKLQRTIGAGHDLMADRFRGDSLLEACYDDEARLTKGAQGESVRKVQQALLDLGYNLGPTGADGIYGDFTWNAVKQFKANEHLGWEWMGDVGPGTMGRLDKLFAGGHELPECPGEGEIAGSSASNLSPGEKKCKREKKDKNKKADCLPAYDTSYAPNSGNCAPYQGTMAKSFLTWTYRHNAMCACMNTPNDPKNNCIRKCLQVKMNAFLASLSRLGAVIGTCIDPIGILDFSCPEPYCRDLYDQHVECYKACCCENDFIGYPCFWFMCEAPYPCFFVAYTIRKTNACDKP